MNMLPPATRHWWRRVRPQVWITIGWGACAIVVTASGLVIWASVESANVVREYAEPYLETTTGQQQGVFRAGETVIVVRSLCWTINMHDATIRRRLTNSQVRELLDVPETFDRGCTVTRFALELPPDLVPSPWIYSAAIRFPLNWFRTITFDLRPVAFIVTENPATATTSQLRAEVERLRHVIEARGKKADAFSEMFSGRLRELTDQMERRLAEHEKALKKK